MGANVVRTPAASNFSIVQTVSSDGNHLGSCAVNRASDFGPRGPWFNPGRCTFRCGLEQVTFTLCLVLVKPRKQCADDRLVQTVTRLEITLCLTCYVVPNVLSPRDLVSRPDIMAETVPHTIAETGQARYQKQGHCICYTYTVYLLLYAD